MRLLRKRVFETKQHGPRSAGPVTLFKSAPAVCDEIAQTAVATGHASTEGFRGFVMEVTDWQPGCPSLETSTHSPARRRLHSSHSVTILSDVVSRASMLALGYCGQKVT